MAEFNEVQRQALLAHARASVASEWSSAATSTPPFDGDNRLAATFVTLTVGGHLRGCIGSLVPQRPLLDDIGYNARAAAFHDPRFLPLSREELADVKFEISVLTEPRPLEFSDENDLFNRLRPEKDGVIIEAGMYRATFLPQVWEQLPTPKAFIRQLLLKAGLPESTPVTTLAVQTYQVESFEEDE